MSAKYRYMQLCKCCEFMINLGKYQSLYTVLPVDFRFFDRFGEKRIRGILTPELKTNQEIDLEILRARASFPQTEKRIKKTYSGFSGYPNFQPKTNSEKNENQLGARYILNCFMYIKQFIHKTVHTHKHMYIYVYICIL